MKYKKMSKAGKTCFILSSEAFSVSIHGADAMDVVTLFNRLHSYDHALCLCYTFVESFLKKCHPQIDTCMHICTLLPGYRIK